MKAEAQSKYTKMSSYMQMAENRDTPDSTIHRTMPIMVDACMDCIHTRIKYTYKMQFVLFADFQLLFYCKTYTNHAGANGLVYGLT